MPRSLERSGYSAEEVAAQLATSGPIDQRFELVGRDYGVIDTLDVTAASVTWEANRTIPRSLRLTMMPRHDLLDVPFRYLVKPWYRVGMPDGGWAEFPMGAYPFTIPERSVEENAAEGSGTSDDAGNDDNPSNPEEWTLTLGDQMHYLDAAGVGPQGFTVPFGAPLTLALAVLLLRNSFTDFTGIADSDATAAQSLSWSLRSGAKKGKWVWYGKWIMVPGDPLEDQATTWAKVAAELHSQLGYLPPGFDLDQDRYVAKAAPDFFSLLGAAPGIAYAPGEGSLLLPEVRIIPNLSEIGNRATVTQSTSTAGVNQVVTMDLNDLLPGHPLSQGRTGFYMELAATSPGGASALALKAQALALLAKGIWSFESVRFTTLANPAHDAWEVGSLRIPDDPVFDVPQLCMESNWTMDLFTGQMSHEWKRLGIPAPGAATVAAVVTTPSPPVAGYQAWYDAADTSTLTLASGRVSQWNDKSANGYHVTQGTAGNQPLYTGAGTINGITCLQFDPARIDHLTNTAYAGAAQPYTVFAVVDADNTAAAKVAFYGSTASTGRGFITLLTTEAASTNFGTTLSGATTGLVSPVLLTSVINGVSSSVYVNSVLDASGDAGANTASDLRIGANQAPLGGFSGLIAEIILYHSILSAEDRLANEEHLRRKWATP